MEDRLRFIAILATWSCFLLNFSLFAYHEYYPDPFKLPVPLDDFVFISSFRIFSFMAIPIPGIIGTYFLHNNLIRFYGASTVVQTLLMVFNITHLFDNNRFEDIARENFTNAMEQYTWRKWHSDKFDSEMQTSIFNHYVDEIHFRFNCCGVRGYQDWTLVKPFYVHGDQLPEPCCGMKTKPQPLKGEVPCNIENKFARSLPGCGNKLTTTLLHRAQCETLLYCIFQIIATTVALAYMHERRKQTEKYEQKLIDYAILRARQRQESLELEQEIRDRLQALRRAEREQRESDIREVHEILKPGQYTLDIERLDDEEYMREYEAGRAAELEKLKMIAKRTVIPQSEVLRLDQAREALALNDFLRPVKPHKKLDADRPGAWRPSDYDAMKAQIEWYKFDRKMVRPQKPRRLPGHKHALYKIPVRMSNAKKVSKW